MRRLSLTVGAALVAATFAGQSSGQQLRVFDRTLLCQTGLQAGQRELYVFASSGFRFADDASRWQRLAQVSLSSPQHASGIDDGGVSAGVRAGSPSPPRDELFSADWTVSLGLERCGPSRTPVRLSPRGLAGGVASRVGESYECYPPKHVLVRVRATFASQAATRVRDGYVLASAPIEAGGIAVRTQGGKALVYGEAFANGRARLFLAGSCQRR